VAAKPATMVAGTTVCVMRVSLLIGAVGDVFVFAGAAGSLDEPMMLSRVTAPTRFRHVANEDRILDDAWRVLWAS
jgi:hypothetical protein